MDRELKAQYGFGIDALDYRGGKIIGKTPEAQAVIDSDEGEFMKKVDMPTSICSKDIPAPRSFLNLYSSIKMENSKLHIRRLTNRAKGPPIPTPSLRIYRGNWLNENPFLNEGGMAYSASVRPVFK